MTHREPWRVSTKNGLDSFCLFVLVSVYVMFLVTQRARVLPELRRHFTRGVVGSDLPPI